MDVFGEGKEYDGVDSSSEESGSSDEQLPTITRAPAAPATQTTSKPGTNIKDVKVAVKVVPDVSVDMEEQMKKYKRWQEAARRREEKKQKK